MIAPPWGYVHDKTDRWPHCVVCHCFQAEKPQHDPGCRTAALESTVEAMARAIARLLEWHDVAPPVAAREEARAALASLRGLTAADPGGKNG